MHNAAPFPKMDEFFFYLCSCCPQLEAKTWNVEIRGEVATAWLYALNRATGNGFQIGGYLVNNGFDLLKPDGFGIQGDVCIGS